MAGLLSLLFSLMHVFFLTLGGRAVWHPELIWSLMVQKSRERETSKGIHRALGLVP